jgi:putative transposase
MSIEAHPRSSRLIIRACGLSASTYYYRRRSPSARGRKHSVETPKRIAEVLVLHDNRAVIAAVERLLSQEFICYGHRAMTAALRREGFCINHKKLYRLMKQERLLSCQRSSRRQKRRVAPRGKVNASRPYQHLQMDIKYVYIHGERRWAYLLTLMDVFTRCLLGQLFARSIRACDVINLLQQNAPNWTTTERIRLRTDHGSQFIANQLVPVLEALTIDHEFTHPGVPEDNAFIEAWHSIFQTEVTDRYEFACFQEAADTIKRHRHWYQHHRLHGSLNYQTPEEFSQHYWQTIKTLALP